MLQLRQSTSEHWSGRRPMGRAGQLGFAHREWQPGALLLEDWHYPVFQE